MFDRNTKVVLTVIAVALSAIAVQGSVGAARAEMPSHVVCEISTDNGADLDKLAAITGKGMTVAEATKLKAICDGH